MALGHQTSSSKGGFGTPAPTPPRNSLAGLLTFQPTPQLSPYPGVAPKPVVPANRTTAIAPQHRAPAPAPRPAGSPAPQGGGAAGGGGGYGGGGPLGDGYGLTATPALGQDPAYLAFLRALGIEKADLNQSAEERIRVINNEIARRLPDILQQGIYAREGIDNNFESRGVFRSGHRLTSLARERADEGQQISSLQGAAADQIFLIKQELARRLGEADRRAAEQSLTSAGNVYG